MFILAIPLALITTNVRVAISEKAVYDYAVQHYGAEKASGIPEAELLRANEQIHSYLTKGQSGALSTTVHDNSGREVSLFNARETAHMADVRDLVALLFTVQMVAVAAVIALGVMLVLWKPRALAAAALCGSLLTAAVLAVGGLLAISGFDAAWAQFHGIAFSNHLWELNPARDHLIQMFPEPFWFDITLLIGVATLLESVLISAGAVVYLAYSGAGAAPRLLPQPMRSLLPGQRPRMSPPNPKHIQ